MILSYDQIKNITVGAVFMENTDEGMKFYKYSPNMISAWIERDPSSGPRVKSTTGIRLDFHTNSKKMKLEIENRAKFEIYIDGLLRYSMKDVESLSVDIDTPRGDPIENAHIVIYFPSHKVGVLKMLELDDCASITPHCFDKKILFMGDSITQGWAAEFDSLSFANKVSRYFNAESVIQGVGGSRFFPNYLEALPIDFDWVVVAYGTNDYDRYKIFEEFNTPMSEYMLKLSQIYGDKKVFVISPIWRKFSTTEEIERFEIYRTAIAAEARKYGFIHIDGSCLVPPIDAFYTDGLHPNDIGFSIYAENLIRNLEQS
jgi:lysophospholipase L1-like esterase